MNKRTYSDGDKAVALATLDANGGNVQKTAAMLRIPRKTLEDWAKGRKVNPEVAEMRHIKKGELAERLEQVAWALTENLAIRATSDLSILVPMKDVATSLGIVVDKMQLLKGELTDIHKDVTPTDAQRQRAAEILRRRGAVQQTGSVDN